MRRKVYLTIGIIASGKSTWSKQFIKENKNVQRVSRDDLRFMTTDYQFTPDNEKIVDKLYRSLIETYLLHTDKDIILDEQNLNVDRKESFKQWVLSIDSDVEFIEKEFPITLSEALSRDAKRAFPIGEKVIKDTWKRYEVELKAMLNRAKPRNSSNSEGIKVVLVDLDGTLAHAKHRNIYDEDKVGTDEIISSTRDLVCSLARYCGYKIIILSGRHESCKDKTVSWLEANDVSFDYIFMRKAGDDRKDTIIKKELYYAHIKNQYNVVMAIDDRPCVGDLWVSEGIPLINVNNDPYCKNNF